MGSDQAELDRVHEGLSDLGFDITYNDLEIPESINGPTLVYSPLNSNITDVDLILGKLHDLGYADISLIEFHKDNHAYTKNNVGIYLHRFEKLRQSGMDIRPIMKEYHGLCPEHDELMDLEKIDVLELTRYEWQESSNAEVEHISNGTWHVLNDKELFLNIDGQQLSFKIEKYYAHANGRNYSVIKLINRSDENEITNCDFEYREILFSKN